MKHIFFLLLFLPVLAYAQFPANPNKIRLGNQTTADGLVVRTAASPSWTPSTINNAWLAFDTVAEKLYYYDGGAWNEYTGSGGTDTNFATDNLTFTGNRVHNLSTRTLTIADGGTYPTFQQSAATDGITLASSATDIIAQTPGLLQIENSDTITVTADRIRMNAADTRIQQLTNDNALNRLVALDSITNKLYYVDKASIAGGGGGGITGSGTTGTIPVWSSSSALGDSPLTVSGTDVTATGTGMFRLPNGTTAQRPGSPAAGMTRYNSTLGNLDFYGASAWENPLRSTTGNGLGTAGRVFYADAAGRAAADDLLAWDATNNRLGVNTATPTARLAIGADGGYNGGLFVGSSAGADATRVALFGQLEIVNNGSPGWSGQGFSIAGANRAFEHIFSPNNSTDNFAIRMRPSSLSNQPTFNRASGTMNLIRIEGGSRTAAGSTAEYSVLNLDINGEGDGTNIQRGLYITYSPVGPFPRDIRYIDIPGNVGKAIYQSGASATNNFAGATHIGATTTPTRTLHVTGEARITDLTTDTPTQIVGADADGDLGAITVGTGLSLSGGTLTATGGAGITNLAFSGSSSPVTLTSDTGTDVIFSAGSGIALSQSTGTMTIFRTYSLIHTTITGGSTFFGTSAERPDNDTPGSATTSAVGSDFSVSGSTVDYTGGSGALIRVEGSISFSVADDGDYYLSLYKEGTEIGATSMRISCVAGNYYSVSLPATTTGGSTNDTFDLRIATVTGNSTTTMHRYGFILERIY